MIALLLTDRCTGCQRCIDICPRQVFDPGALTHQDSPTDRPPPVIARADDCQTCFACELYCAADALYVEPDVNERVPVDEAAVRASGLLGVYRRDSGWDEWHGDPRYANQHWRMEEVFARGREAPARGSVAPVPAP